MKIKHTRYKDGTTVNKFDDTVKVIDMSYLFNGSESFRNHFDDICHKLSEALRCPIFGGNELHLDDKRELKQGDFYDDIIDKADPMMQDIADEYYNNSETHRNEVTFALDQPCEFDSPEGEEESKLAYEDYMRSQDDGWNDWVNSPEASIHRYMSAAGYSEEEISKQLNLNINPAYDDIGLPIFDDLDRDKCMEELIMLYVSDKDKFYKFMRVAGISEDGKDCVEMMEEYITKRYD